MTNPTEPIHPEVPGYEFERLIGVGGMGEVHLARQVTLNRPVAIKFLRKPPVESSDAYVARFHREVELMARVSHPNVVMIIDSGDVDGRPYLVMEYVEGGDLRSKMVPEVPMPVGEIRAILGPILKAVEFLHAQGMVHRDIKPENILMLRGETPKVSDFGIAVLDFAIGSLTTTGLSLGTPGYVAPEQQYGLRVDTRADQFSIAALAYEMGTGRKPLGAFQPPDRLNPKLGPRAAAVILKGLSEDPSDRFPTIQEFAEAIDRALEVDDARKIRRRRWLLVSALVALIAIGVTSARFLAPIPMAPTRENAESPQVHQPAVVPESKVELPRKLAVPSLDLGLVLVPAGEFWMGSPDEDKEAPPNERPMHRVAISRPFYLGRTEVTVGQFRKYVEETGAKTTAESPAADGRIWGGSRYNVALKKWEQDPVLNWRNPGLKGIQDDDEPVVQVSWDDATGFCKWLSDREKRPFRLPTEAEWEYACRGGSQGRWCFGDDPARLDEFAWNIHNAGDRLHPVAALKSNGFDLFDMHGNAWEWCLDEYRGYAEAPVVEPQELPSRANRVLRGGSFDWGDVKPTRSAARHHLPPYLSFTNYGFRVCSPAY